MEDYVASEEKNDLLFQRSLNNVVERYANKYEGVFAHETVERVVYESYAALLRTAKNKQYLITLTEKFSGDRLRSLFVSQDESRKDKPEVLFVCVQNAGRSQMAMAFMNELSEGKVVVRSAGSMPASEVSAKAVEVMKEIGIELTEAFPKPLTDDVVRASDVVITMGCGDACPLYPGKRYLDWDLDDPAELELDQVRRVRDEIKARVEALLVELI
ncbi:MAG: arsenate reductase ArsC [Actinobacteria bacterium]|jgi:arsenate reductase|nr:arsenate reductase ArsC [Actinomycetota bacterium]NCV36512.1 arsenate reductase ArsC [Actinomycetota bacterium]NCV81083.1 arsenate reductase ArsC [Actinomycetota bacterium]NCV98515.1 arsenate reductase ArsC [Actinomycetota bacterium]NCW23362.1 arsenate reductase ArsC [Actinomycetota bacterium]